MKKIILSLLVLLTPLCAMSRKSKKIEAANVATTQWRYEIEPVAVANGKIGVVTDQSRKAVVVWSYAAKPEIASAQAAKNAVHAVIFKGVPAAGRVAGVRPLVSDLSVEQRNAEYFRQFFDTGGAYMRFVVNSSHGKASNKVIKLRRKEYKVGVRVEVNINELRRELERAGVVKSLGGQF